MSWIHIVFVLSFYQHDVAGVASLAVSRPPMIDDQKILDTLTGIDNVRCTTIDDVAAARRDLCPFQCRCAPVDSQEVLTKLTVDCSRTQSTSSRLTRDLTRLLSRCVSELTELNIISTPLTAVPEVVCRLSKIRSLSLDNNRLASLPVNCFTRMRNLTSFSADNNQLTSLQVR